MAEEPRLGLARVVPGTGELTQIQEESEEQLRRTRRAVWMSALLGLSMGLVLVTWAILGPHLSDRIQLIFGLLVALEATAMGFVLAIYAHLSQMRVLQQYLGQLRDLAKRLQEVSVLDSLTGLYNHGYLLTRLEEEISLARRHQRQLSVVILDLDEFKKVNDQHGHLVGDEVLQFIARTIQQQVRQHDIVARYGGDEFCLVMPETDGPGARKVAEKLRDAVAAQSKRLGKWTDGSLSFGFGIASYPEDGTGVRSLIAIADAQLYQEKDANRLERAQEVRAPDTTRKRAGSSTGAAKAKASPAGGSA